MKVMELFADLGVSGVKCFVLLLGPRGSLYAGPAQSSQICKYTSDGKKHLLTTANSPSF